MVGKSVAILLLAALVVPGGAVMGGRRGAGGGNAAQHGAPQAGRGRLSFTGTLVAVTTTSIMVRQVGGIVIAAALPPTGPLSGARLSAAYALGQYVQADCARLDTPQLDPLSAHMRVLELTALFDLGQPSQADLEAAADSRPARTPGNLLHGAPPAAPAPVADPVIASMRAAVLAYLAQMPNYIADESEVRSSGVPDFYATSAIDWQPFDRIDATVSVVDGTPTRSDIRRDGSPWNQPYAALPGPNALEPFWETPAAVLAPGCPVTIAPGRPVSDAGVPALVFAFTAPPDACGAQYQEGFEEYYPATAGELVVGRPDGSLRRMERHTLGFPPQFSVQSAAYEVTWGDVADGDKTYHVPTAATITVEFIPRRWSRSVYRYTNYRHFSVSHKIIIGH